MRRFQARLGTVSQGFTLVELMVVIGIVAILSVVAIPNFLSWLPKTQAGSAAREILTTIQLAKMAAIKDSSNVVVHFTTGECLAFVDDGAGGGTADDRVRNGSERLVRIYRVPPGVTLSVPSFGADLEFSNRGLPSVAGGCAGRHFRQDQNHSGAAIGARQDHVSREMTATPKQGGDNGFTLVELMVAMVISTVVLGLIVASLFSQQKNHVTQDALVDMQQSLRAALEVMGSDLKMAGYDPIGSAGAAFLVADRAELQFQLDRNGDGDFVDIVLGTDPGELIRYALTNDADRDGVADGTACDLGRALDGGGLQVLAENIDALNFVYFDRNGTELPTPVADRSLISSVQVTVVARSGRVVPALFIRHRDATVYHNRQGTTILSAPNDDFRRFAIMHEFKCRNLHQN